ncbi:MAG TPA: cobaltochelatase subunit CobN, partial [Methanothrix sp.]|nr:cobaltochelatase subunit CobN [Methanothrix sp.]
AFLSTTGLDVFPMISALKELIEESGEIAEVCLRSKDDLADAKGMDEFMRFAVESNIAIISLHGGKKSLGGFEEMASKIKEAKVLLYAQETSKQDAELMSTSTVSRQMHSTIFRYLSYGGKDNFKNLLIYCSNSLLGTDYDLDEPKRPPWEGIYHPDIGQTQSIDEYLCRNFRPGRPTIGILFHNGFWQAENLRFIDSLIREIEGRDANVIAVFLYSLKDVELGTKGIEWVIENYFMKDGRPLIDTLISTLMFSLTMRPRDEEKLLDKPFFEKLGVPVIKAILTYNTEEQWRQSFQGLNPMDVSMSIAMPEFDGMLISVPVAAKKVTESDALTGARVTIFEPIAGRVQKAVSLSLNWARLRHIPNDEKKVAIIFHNYPPRNDRIGCAFGLDSPVSVLNILRDLEKEGYKLESLPKSGQELIESMIARVTNDRRWSSPEKMSETAIDLVSTDKYRSWFEMLPEAVQDKMVRQWKEPPGEIFAHRGRLIIPGIINGNVFIGLQPPRGFLEDPASIYHSPDIPVPHHYYAYYRWIRDVFKANVVMHIGKHGSLEWLPGKSVGLSESCFPDIAISDLPNIYPYIINNPGEGTQAKRRSYCCIIDHLIPVMHNADSYEELAEIDVLLRDYSQAVMEDPAKIQHLKRSIWAKACEAKLDHDLNLIEKDVFADFDSFLERLHDYLYDIKDTQIRDGLHIFGEPPEGSRLDEFLVALTRLKNGSVPSLREALAHCMGFDLNRLLENRGRAVDGIKTGGQVIENIHEMSLCIIRRFHELDFALDSIPSIQMELTGRRDPEVEAVLQYIGSNLLKNIISTTDELTNTLAACRGGYVPPGPSGAPTRGMADILPTGRNFYSVDPLAIPSQTAWKVGVSQAQALLERYLRDEGEYPQNVGFIVWGSPIMRTKGDDVAEILYLMGVRPVWEKMSGRVTGLELIALDELKRPRIDVTLRISGFFRDAFPNIVSLLDEAVELVAGLKEPVDSNYLARHVSEEMAEKVRQGMNADQAREEACYRIFGCRPGAYGAGICEAIDSKNWKDEHDLADIYVTWGGYAYGRKNFGITVPEQFKKRLSQLDLTVKNEDTREYDMLDGDDFYSFHGGMIAAVKALKGSLPKSYCGDSSDPDRVRIRNTFEETKHIFRARILNPKWIESMKRHGYKGAGDISRMVDIAFGWDATAEVLEDWMYEELANKYALDEQMQEWLKDVNPHALLNISERLLEAIERNMWNAGDEMKEKL